MSTHKHIDRIALLIILTVLAGVLILFAGMGASGERTGMEKEYETGLFSTDQVHTIEITMDDWEGFLEDCENEEYVMCDVTIDGQTVREVGIRAKGNTSLTQVKNYGNDRYSFKLEFDHYQDGIQYQGLDKLNLNNIIQDNTYMKDYLSYRMMQEFGVDAPLCSYAYITVNGEEWKAHRPSVVWVPWVATREGKKDSRRAGLTARKKGRHPRVREKNQPNKRREG